MQAPVAGQHPGQHPTACRPGLGPLPLLVAVARLARQATDAGRLPGLLQGTVAKLLGARGIRSAFETVGIILMLLT